VARKYLELPLTIMAVRAKPEQRVAPCALSKRQIDHSRAMQPAIQDLLPTVLSQATAAELGKKLTPG